MKQVVIFTDGSSRGNPGPGGWGAIAATEEKVEELGGGEKRTTNNRMELLAVIEGLKHAKKFSADAITVYSDSMYVINGATKWVHGWKRNGWKTKEKSDVLNKDLWEQLSELLTKDISWHKVGGHVNVPGNERADEIATSFADGAKIDLYNGSRKNYLHDLTRIEHDAAAHAERSKSRARSSAKAYSYVSLVDGRIMTHKTWDECKQRVDGKMARFKKALTKEEEAEIVRQFKSN